jgi:prepilin-type N-terminal cleavage/methylation domain-containing protein
MRKSTIRKAFTLVEILIVVVILGILAAIVVPQFTSATQDSQAGNIKSQLGTLQRQIELYQAKNNEYPNFGTEGWGTTTDLTSMIGGKFIKEAPSNPAGTLTSAQRKAVGVVTGTAKGLDENGWAWNSDDNTIYASFFNEATGQLSTTPAD